jgi:3'-phosphoadenosine 5'-phosphosulfate sulfotransferase (PAPS reductase)/FAD synthetase
MSTPTDFFFGCSGGKDSTALLLWALNDSGYPRDRIHAVFCDTGNENQITLDYIAMLSEKVFPIHTVRPDRDFFELAAFKRRFPSSQARFCTEHLKMFPSKRFVDGLRVKGAEVLIHSGVRGDESEARANLMPRAWDGYYGCHVYRPLLDWSTDQVFAYLAKHGVPPNPLYAMGARRVGCFPCIMSSKPELRVITRKFPEVLTKLRAEEQRIGSTFFTPNHVPPRFRSKPVTTADGRRVMCATIDDVARWSLTGKGAVGVADTDENNQCQSSLGACE